MWDSSLLGGKSFAKPTLEVDRFGGAAAIPPLPRTQVMRGDKRNQPRPCRWRDQKAQPQRRNKRKERDFIRQTTPMHANKFN